MPRFRLIASEDPVPRLFLARRCAGTAIGIFLACCGPTRAQIYRPVVAPPPQVLTPRPGSPAAMEFQDPFLVPPDNRLLRPWHTFHLPPGITGLQTGWDQTSLEASTIRRYRISLFQPWELSGGYVARGPDGPMGYSFASAGGRMVVPLGDTTRLLSLRPVFRADWLDAEPWLDLPDTLYSMTFELGVRLELTCDWSVIAGVQPGWFNDSEFGGRGSRLQGLVLVSYEVIPEVLTLMAGVARLDRNDYDVIPVAGITWLPDPDTRIELTFPKPKIAKRIGHVPWLLEDWLYVGASFGGNTWSVHRGDGSPDELTMFDLRVVGGYERILDGGTGYSLEAGYVTARELEFESAGVPVELPGSLIVELNFRF